MSILIVEDFPPQQKLLGTIVKSTGLDCEIVSTGDEVLKALKKNRGNTAWILDGYFPCEKAKSPVYDPQIVKDWISRVDAELSNKKIE